jgi:hypothetical protein
MAAAAARASSGAEDIIKVKRDIIISKGMSANDVVLIHGSATVYGTVEGNIVILGGSLYLKEGALVRGHAVVIGGEIVREGPSRIEGKTTQVYIPRFLPSAASFLSGAWIIAWAAISVLVLIGFLGLAVLLVALIPSHVATAVSAMEGSFGAVFLWGIFWTAMIVPAAILLALSVVGIVLIPLEILLAALAYLVGYIVSAIYLGKSIFLSLKQSPPPFVDAIAGILILYAVGFVPVLGAAIKAVFLIAGFGAVMATKFGTAAVK